MAMGKTGGILMLVSLFIPVWMIYVRAQLLGFTVSFTMLYWLFGLYYIMVEGLSGFGFLIGMVSIAVFGLILVFSILAIVKEGTTQMVMGLLSLFAMAAYLIYMDLGIGFGFLFGIGTIEIIFFPIGGGLCLIAAALTIWGGAKSRM